MSTVTTPTTAWQWPPDFVECARRFKIESHLDTLLSTLRDHFPTARSLNTVKEDDPEIEDFPYLVFEVRIAKADVPDYLAATHRWHDAVRQILPPGGPYPVCLSLLREDP